MSLNFRDDPEAEQEIGGMPGIFRFGVNRLENHLKKAVQDRLSSVLLFGVPFSLPKDDRGSAADHPNTPVILAIQKLKTLFPNLVIACDVSSKFIIIISHSSVFLLIFKTCLTFVYRKVRMKLYTLCVCVYVTLGI